MDLLLPRTDEDWMRLALRQAEKAADAGEVPIGAVIVFEGSVIARSCNQVETLKDATAHAEVLALTQAAAKLGRWRLNGCTLYVTKEPCPMCAGALANARVDRVVFGVPDAKAGGCGGFFAIHQCAGLLHSYPVLGGVLEEESLAIIQEFFRRRRAEQKEFKKQTGFKNPDSTFNTTQTKSNI